MTGDTHGERVAAGSVKDRMANRKHYSEYKASRVKDQRKNNPFNQRSDEDLTWLVKKSNSEEYHTKKKAGIHH